MASLLTIANKALRKLGVRELNSLDQGGSAADRCNSAIIDCVKDVLAEHSWSHATVWAKLAKLSTPPPFGYDCAYQLPAECVRCFDVREDTDLRAPLIDFEQARGNLIYTDADPCYARYVVYFEEDLAKASPGFIEACAFKLAEEICVPLAKSELLAPVSNGYKFALDRARLGDAATKRERPVDPNRECSFLAARGYPYDEEDAS